MLSRAKRTDNGEWVFGTYHEGVIIPKGTILPIDTPEYHDEGMGCGLEDRNITDRYEAMHYGWEKCCDRFHENMPELFDVDAETVGQELHFKCEETGYRVFMGDILTISWPNGDENVGRVVFNERLERYSIMMEDGGDGYPFEMFDQCSVSIIGNNHDNPELIPKP